MSPATTSADRERQVGWLMICLGFIGLAVLFNVGAYARLLFIAAIGYGVHQVMSNPRPRAVSTELAVAPRMLAQPDVGSEQAVADESDSGESYPELAGTTAREPLAASRRSGGPQPPQAAPASIRRLAEELGASPERLQALANELGLHVSDHRKTLDKATESILKAAWQVDHEERAT